MRAPRGGPAGFSRLGGVPKWPFLGFSGICADPFFGRIRGISGEFGGNSGGGGEIGGKSGEFGGIWWGGPGDSGNSGISLIKSPVFWGVLGI